MFKSASLEQTPCDKIVFKPNYHNDKGTYFCRNCGLGLLAVKKTLSHDSLPTLDFEILQGLASCVDDSQNVILSCQRCKQVVGKIRSDYKNTDLPIHLLQKSLDFTHVSDVLDSQEAIIAAGCFWGVEYLFNKIKGVIKTEVGYMGGFIQNPDYHLICEGNTGHREVVRILYDPKIIDYTHIIKHFFEIHDFTQVDGQGGDKGEQYTSAIFHYDQDQYNKAADVIQTLSCSGYKVATQLLSVQTFWPAETYHQQYYKRTKGEPYCHIWQKIF